MLLLKFLLLVGRLITLHPLFPYQRYAIILKLRHLTLMFKHTLTLN